MKSRLSLLFGLVLLGMLLGTASSQVITQGVQYVFIAPSGTCLSTNPAQILTTTGVIYTCQSVTNNVGTWAAATSSSGPGSVSSVGLTMPTGFSVANSPVTTSGTFNVTTSGLTINALIKAVSGGFGNSQVTDDGTHNATSPDGFGLSTSGGITFDKVNDTSTGTTLNLLVCKGSVAGSVVTCPSNTKTGVLGSAVAGVGTAPGTSGSTSVCFSGICSAIADGTTVIGHYGIPSATAGRIHDTGATTPTANTDSFLITSVTTVGNPANYEISTPDWFAQQAVAKVYQLQVAGGTVFTAGDNVNFNATTPADAGAYGNCTFATSKSGTTDSVSLNCDGPIGNAVAGVNPAVAVQAATTAAGDTSGFAYLNGVSGIGATLTGPTANVAVTIDGFTFTAIGQRLLVKNDTQSPSGAFNGIYFLSTLQAPAIKPVFTRSLDFDQSSDINNTGAIPVINGTVNGTTQWVVTSTVNTVGTDPVTFAQFTSNPANQVTASATLTNNAVMIGQGSKAAATISADTTTTHALFATAGAPAFRALATTDLPTPLLATGTSVSLTAPSEIYVCTGTCTVTPPVPAAGYEFCVMNDDNVATVITLAALGSSARYENTGRTAYGTAGTGTFVSGGAVKDMVCLVGRDSTHYLTTNFNGTWTAN